MTRRGRILDWRRQRGVRAKLGAATYGTDPKGNEMAAVNARCLEGVELEKIPVKHFDGKAT